MSEELIARLLRQWCDNIQCDQKSKCARTQDDCNIAWGFYFGAKLALATRDKGWVVGGDKLFQPHCLCYPDGCSTSGCTEYPCSSFGWQQLKKDMGITE